MWQLLSVIEDGLGGPLMSCSHAIHHSHFLRAELDTFVATSYGILTPSGWDNRNLQLLNYRWTKVVDTAFWWYWKEPLHVESKSVTLDQGITFDVKLRGILWWRLAGIIGRWTDSRMFYDNRVQIDGLSCVQLRDCLIPPSLMKTRLCLLGCSWRVHFYFD